MSIPEDVVDEILSRVPATNLKRLRPTCQRWNRLYKDAWFARKHLDKSPKEFSSVIKTTDSFIRRLSISLTSSNTVPSVELKGELKQINPYNPNVIHCDGLLLCTSADETRCVVWNLLTGETSWITLPRYRWTFALGYCNTSKSYKILSCGFWTSDMQIYDLSPGSWRILGHDVITPRWLLSFSHQIVSLKGNAYMFVTDVAETRDSLSLLNFDFSTEKAVTMPLPRQWNRPVGLSVVREEKIAVFLEQKGRSTIEIWLSNKIDQVVLLSWSKILALDLSCGLVFSYFATFLLDEEKKILVLATERWFDGVEISGNIYIVGEDSKVTQVPQGDMAPHKINGSWPTIHNYVPSLVQINQAGYKIKEKR